MADTRGNKQQIADAKAFHYPKRNDLAAEADMVMKGGITSGIVYPLAVCEIAKQYRLRNVGGSSAGGIAAAFAACAERNRDGGGYGMLAGLPERLGNGLADLFQPSPGTAPLFRLLSAWIDRRSALPVRLAKLVGGLARAGCCVFWPAFGGVFAVEVAVLLAATAGPYDARRWAALAVAVLLAATGALVVALALTVAVTIARASTAVTQNGYGLCIGSHGAEERPGPKPFVDWMHTMLGEVAGLPGQVVHFRDLWGTTATDTYREHHGTSQKDRDRAMAAIDPDVRLEMMTTNVTFARPMRVPWTTAEFLACPEDMARWFPPDVAAVLLATKQVVNGEPLTCPDHPGATLRKLPEPPDVPVVFAVRMTLSFPGLISAVPLYRVDFSGGKANAAPVRCWFSDGGISSNFPVHFFDSLIPRRPTFGINLVPYHPAYPGDDVYYPVNPDLPAQPRMRPTTTLGGFVGALVDTLQNWSDEAQVMLPTFRERVVEVHLHDDEGGMNLYMKPETILDVAVRGARAGRKLLERFDFDHHRLKRYQVAMSELQQSVNGMDDRLDARYRAVLDRHYGPASGEVARTDTLLAFSGKVPDFEKDAPRPDGDLRITPHF